MSYGGGVLIISSLACPYTRPLRISDCRFINHRSYYWALYLKDPTRLGILKPGLKPTTGLNVPEGRLNRSKWVL